jgi:hypothetical protein
VTIRASDDDRQRTVAALERHTGAGRLTLDEFAERVRTVHDARTLDELAEIMHDLPPDEPAPAQAAERPRRDLLLLFAFAAAALLVLGLLFAITR